MIYFKYLLFLFILLTDKICFCQTQQYISFTKLSQQNILPSYNVKKTIQDSKGFVWIGTQDGLFRYDSKSIKNIKEGVTDYDLSGNAIWDIKEDTINNILWVAAYNSVDGIDLKTGIVKYRIKAKLTDSWVKTILLNNNEVWIGAYNGFFIYNITTKKMKRLSVFDSDKKNNAPDISSLVRDRYNRIWAFSPDFGVVILNGTNKKVTDSISIDKLGFSSVQDFRVSNKIMLTHDDKILLAASGGFRLVSYSNYGYQIQKLQTNCAFGEFISTYDLDNNGNLWFATDKALYKYEFQARQCVQVTDKDKFQGDDWLSSVFDIRIDKRDNIWLSTQKGVAYSRLTDKPFRSFYISSDNKTRINHAYYIFKENDSTLLVCAEDGFYEVSTTSYKISTISNAGRFFYSFRAPDNSIIVSSEKRMYLLNHNRLQRIESHYKELLPIVGESINSTIQLGDSVIVMGSESIKGVFIWNIKKHTLSTVNTTGKQKLASDIVNYIGNTSDKKICILSDNFISVLDIKDNSVKNLQLYDSLLKANLILFFDITAVKDTYYTCAYGKGVLRLNSNFKIEKRYTELDGLANNGVYKIFNVGDTSLFITTNNGLSIFNIKTESFKNYYQSDGLHSNAFEEASGTIKEGLIYAGGVNGFTIIDPSKFGSNTRAPKLYISRILVEGTQNRIDTNNIEIQKLIIPNDVLQTTIYLSGINWSNPERTNFAWRILENTSEWSNIGTQNFIPLIGLSYGTFHLQVKTANEDGVWSEPKELILIFLPKWYQTWWFKLLVFLTTAGIIYAFYRYRIAQIKKQHEIRKNIATDLHDDLGSTLNSVKVFTNLAIDGVKQEESLQQVKDNLTEATMSLRDMIWVLDDSLDTVDELITRLKQFAIPVAAASNIQADIKADSEVNNRQLTKEEKRNLFLICKEAINNSIKYSGASQIDVTIAASGKKIQIVAADNGKGFDVAEVKKGYGLKNMQYRAGQIKYKASLSSLPGKGTRVEIKPD